MEELFPLLAACATFAHAESMIGEAAVAELRASLRAIFSVLAELAVANPKRRGWTTNPKKPGFLVHALEHGGEALEIHVPLTILDSFPSAEILSELAGLAKSIRSGQDTTICLSGSAAVYSALQMVGDIDFCEYVELPSNTSSAGTPDRSFARTLAKAASLDEDGLACLKIAFSSSSSEHRVISRPWSTPPSKDTDLLALARKARDGKCDFIARTRFQEIIEVTNVVLFIDPERPDHSSGERSFPFQEAPITSIGGWIPRNLDEPLVLGRYINWLRGEAEKQIADGKLGKAAKRTYALANALFRPDIADKILDLFGRRSQDLVLGSALQGRLELYGRLRTMVADPVVLAFAGPLAETLVTLARKADRLELPHPPELGNANAFASWCEKVGRYLQASPKGHEELREEIRALLQELAGLFPNQRL